LLHIAADRVDSGQAWGVLQEWRDDPVLDCTQIGCLVGLADKPLPLGRYIASVGLNAGLPGGVAILLSVCQMNRPHQDVAEAGGDRPHLWPDVLGKALLCASQPLCDLRPGEIDVGGLGEDRRYLREAIAAKRPCVF